MPASHGAWKILWSLNPSEALTVFERILLITDGTVTDLLEAFAGEAISVVKLSQSIGHRNGDAHALDVLEHEHVLQRTVLLRGADSGTSFLYGDSVIVPERLPPALFEGLMATGQTIGRLLATYRLETFREIVDVRFGAAAKHAE